MSRSRKPAIPPPRTTHTVARPPRTILELDRFAEADVDRWNDVSADLNELNDVLHFGLEPERRRRRLEILAALSNESPTPIDISGWVRVVTYQYSSSPLSCAGSLTYVGGRFNAGLDLEPNTIEPWPALYVAENFETAYREKFQRAKGEIINGLTPEELALNAGGSHATLLLRGMLGNVFDMTGHECLDGVGAELAKIKMPERAKLLKRKLKIPDSDLGMARTGKQLHESAVAHNWRILPVQYGLPAPSQILAEMIRAAGFEGILYSSTKSGGKCLAIFPDKLADGSYVELMDAAPEGVTDTRLDSNTADALSGWDDVIRRR